MGKITELTKLGQSIWFDYIRRSFTESGELQNLIDNGVRGVTSNPTIFEKAIAGSADYDEALQKMVQDDLSVDEIYEAIVLEDIARAADLFLPVYKKTNGLDGYVSLEVSPTLAHDTDGTIKDARRFFAVLDRPNIMIKVPATPEGIPAIKTLIGEGINVNVTLMFNMHHYLDVTEAYLQGLERYLADGGDLSKVASVASFFVSRVDTVVDRELGKKGNTELQGKIAIANAKVVYDKFLKIFSGPRWQKLAEAGARVQRPLWASTGTKNPLYPDTLYVDQLIGENTVNTVPPATLTAFRDHGTVAATLVQGMEEAKDRLIRLNDLGIDLDEITEKLQKDGVASFADSFDKLMKAIAGKREQLLKKKKYFQLHLGDYQDDITASLKKLKQEKVVARIWEHDYTVWKPDPTGITDRLGWLASPEVMKEAIKDIEIVAHDLRADGITDALLMGMGGSSLAPDVFQKIFGAKDGYLNLTVLDSTDPAAVLAVAKRLNPATTVYIASTKSGGTVETLSFLKYFYNQALEKVGAGNVGKHFVAITDPGSSLETLANDLHFRRTFLNDPNIGGRYSALSCFGLVPAGLLGIDLIELLENAGEMACNCEASNCPVAGNNTGAQLGVVLGEMARKGRDKLTLIISPEIAPFGAWVEQLIAESTGKEGTGILPVVGEEVLVPEEYAADRLFVYLHLDDDHTLEGRVNALIKAGLPLVQINLKDRYALGGEFFRWEMATVIAGHFLKINPFDQPNVEAAKDLARKMVTAYHKEGTLPQLKPSLQTGDVLVYGAEKAKSLQGAIDDFLCEADLGDAQGKGRSYVALQAFVQPTTETDIGLEKLRGMIQKKYQLATTVGYGPRFLHSTGQ
ncbi:MAG: bifunctional transaldolase/phosoglucose isomerase, partial [Calditrichaeota bacterium]|nr:bifunctional transaldolase/phosoglucose isomerase [Calditrichota bacterium]